MQWINNVGALLPRGRSQIEWKSVCHSMRSASALPLQLNILYTCTHTQTHTHNLETHTVFRDEKRLTCSMHKYMHTSAQTQENVTVTVCDVCLIHYGCAHHLSNSIQWKY